MAYTTIDDPSAYFQTVLYTGNATARSITNTGNSDLQPDWIWIKSRSTTHQPVLTDSVRGTGKELRSDTTDVESSLGNITAFNSDGFSIGTRGEVNNSGSNFVAWNWKAGGSASSNEDGSITSTVSANTTAGFSIVSYTGNETAGATVGHGLGSVPAMIIVKSRSVGDGWRVYHHKVSSDPETDYLVLNNTNANADYNGYWNDTAPTSSVFSLGAAGEVNTNGSTNIAYCFTEIKGYSKFGSYTGNGNADGTFVYLGFKPRWIMIKGTNIARNWGINDTKRSPINQTQDSLYANVEDAETGSGNYIDFTASGFKLRDSALTMNGAYNYIYMAFAENPFVTSTGVPATAR